MKYIKKIELDKRNNEKKEKVNNFVRVKYWKYKTKFIDSIIKVFNVTSNEWNYDNYELIIYDIDNDEIKKQILNPRMILQIIDGGNDLSPANDDEINLIENKIKE
jgi:hypothetical protein